SQEHRQAPEQALSLLDRAEKLSGGTMAIHMRRARYLKLLGERATKEEESVQTPVRATDLDAQDHFLVGQEHYSQGELALAIQEFRGALHINAQHFWARYFLGLCYVMSGKPDVAEVYLTECQRQRPEP